MPPLYSSIHSKRTVYRIALIKIYLIIFKIIRKNRILNKKIIKKNPKKLIYKHIFQYIYYLRD